MTITGKQGIAALSFVLWVPGNHAPSGPVQNIAEIKITDCDGNDVLWTRDIHHTERINLEMPDGCDTVRVEMLYIASQPSVISGSSDSYGRPNFGAINWNTVLLYPIGPKGDEYTHQNTVVTPGILSDASWEQSTFHASLPLAQLVDSPLILGEHLTTTELNDVNGKPHSFHAVASEERFTKPHDWFIEKLNAMTEQATKIFGPFPRDRYDFLIVLDDHVRFGLEHGQSTFVGTKQKRLVDAKETKIKGGGGDLTVIPHEYIHVWCGKLRAPEGMITPTFHDDGDTELLWVYEGLTTYYTDTLAARAGLLSRDEYEYELALSIIAYEQRAGRLWRPLVDTARAARHLRDRGKYWIDYRRGQDYYVEGALFWMEADVIIRANSNGEKSLDDFCKAFFDVPVKPVGDVETYTRTDVVRMLAEIEPSTDWDAMIRERIEQPRVSLDFDSLLAKLGVELTYESEPTALQKDADSEEGINLRTRHIRPTRTNPQGGVITKEAPIHISNVSPVVDGKAVRVRFKMRDDGSKVRVSATSDEKMLGTVRGPRTS